MEEWGEQARAELQHARDARRAGKEGMARVCSRRAAGIIAVEYLRREGVPVTDPSAIHSLQTLQGMPGIPVDTHLAINALLLRVSTDHTLPANIDLIEAALGLARSLLGTDLE